MPNSENYDEDATVSENNVFEEFDQPLRENGLQLGFINTQSDEYIAVLHKIQDKEKVEKAVMKMGYEYYEK